MLKTYFLIKNKELEEIMSGKGIVFTAIDL